ncbi:hypothetical protein JHL17_13305 [Azospirillum sp. YIM B02556]|uniref:Uncharacterized protein n=1 Tax=Azospirillum endophyticum TaxID=2800326 RepID=A0ABS1F4Q3_9PROT|nr:hypothetical protein [Azospirillum endophyticum]MBK1838391.1 hypothetical protein [Azospirillum endophyticum]
MVGEVQFAAIAKTEGRMVARLDGLHPTINAGFGLFNDNIKVDAHINTTRARLKGNVLGIVKATLILPTLEGMDEKTVRQMFLNFLKPSVDLEALLSGRFTVDPSSGKGKDEEVEAGSKDGDDGRNGESGDDGDDLGSGLGDRREIPSTVASQLTPKPAPIAPLWFNPPPDARPGSYQGEPGPCQPKAENVGGGGLYRVLLSCPGFDPYNESGLLFRKEDADNLVSGSFVLQRGEPITLDDGRLFQLACAPWPCGSDGVFAVSVSKEPTNRTLQAPVKILLPIGDIYRGPEVRARALPFLRLANLIAERQLSGRRTGPDTLILICIRRTDEHCEKAVANLSLGSETSDGSRWSVYDVHDWEFQLLNRQALAHRLLDLKCPVAKGCNGDAAILLQQWDGYRIWASGRSQPGGLPRGLLVQIPMDKGTVSDRLVVLNDNGSIKQDVPITYKMGSNTSPMYYFWAENIYDFLVPICVAGKPGCTLSESAANAIVPLIDQLAAAPTTPIRIGGGGAYAAAISGQGEAETIFSALKTRVGTSQGVCSRSAKWSDIRKQLSRNLDGKDVLYGRDIYPDQGSEWTKQLLGSEGDWMFMEDLINPPQLSRTGYHRSPLQFFPAPEFDKTCLQVSYP